jgi:hypothetical protein
MQLVPVIAIRIAVESISGPEAVKTVKRVLPEAAGCDMIAEAEVLAAESGSTAESAGVSHAAEMRAATEAHVAAAKAHMSASEATAAVATATAAMCLSRSDRQC